LAEPDAEATAGARVQSKRKRPLCVELDGALLKSKVIWGSLSLYLKRHPLGLFRMPLWLLKDKAHFRAQITSQMRLMTRGNEMHEDPVVFAIADWRSHLLALLGLAVLLVAL